MLGHFIIERLKWHIMLKESYGILKNHEKFSTNTPFERIHNLWAEIWETSADKTPLFYGIHGGHAEKHPLFQKSMDHA